MSETTTPGRRRRARSDDVGFVIRDFPVALKRAIAAEAEEQGVSLQDVAVGALADAYGVEYNPTGRKSAGLSDGDYVGLRMPRRLRKKIGEHAARRETSRRSIVLAILSERFPAQ